VFAAVRQLFTPILKLAAVQVFAAQQRPELSARALIGLRDNAQLVFSTEMTTGTFFKHWLWHDL
jgi:hypothetical protein